MRWSVQPLGSLATRCTSGGTPATGESSYYGGDIPWLRTQEVIFNYIYDTEIKITNAGLENSAAKWIAENSVIVALYGNSAGRVAINKIALTTNQACGNFTIDPSKADYRFVYYALLKDYEVLHGMAKGAAQNNLNLVMVKDYNLRVPTLAIQQRIASILSTYDDAIENNRRRMALLEKAARLLYEEWFVRLRFPGHEHTKIINGIPAGWKKKTAIEVMDVLSGGTPKTTNPAYWDGDIPFFTPKDSVDYAYVFETEKTITEEGLKNCNSKLYGRDTLFITARGTVGKINLAQRSMAMNQSCYALIARPPLNQHFMYFALAENIEQFRSRAVGAVFDAIIVDTFKMIPFVVPDKKIIDLFTENVLPMLLQMDNLSMQNRQLNHTRDLLLPRLMNGAIAV